MAMVSSLAAIKDSRWLQLEVCREFQRNKCTRSDTDCKFAHPPSHVEVQNGRVIACYDSIKGRCNREKPPCKYFHPPQHLKDQLLINGRNHLALKNALLQQIPLQPLLTGQLPTAVVSGLLYSQLAQQQQQQLQQQQQCAAALNLMNSNALKVSILCKSSHQLSEEKVSSYEIITSENMAALFGDVLMGDFSSTNLVFYIFARTDYSPTTRRKTSDVKSACIGRYGNRTIHCVFGRQGGALFNLATQEETKFTICFLLFIGKALFMMGLFANCCS